MSQATYLFPDGSTLVCEVVQTHPGGMAELRGVRGGMAVQLICPLQPTPPEPPPPEEGQDPEPPQVQQAGTAWLLPEEA